jgi:hypothetical protein
MARERVGQSQDSVCHMGWEDADLVSLCYFSNMRDDWRTGSPLIMGLFTSGIALDLRRRSGCQKSNLCW